MLFLPRHIRKHYENNASRDISSAMDERGLLNGQGREALAPLSFGFSNVGHAGCESIAVYNVLRLLGIPRPLPEVIRAMEKGGYMRFGGYMGAAPYFQPLLRRYGATGRIAISASVQNKADHRELEAGAVFLVSIWNDRFRPYKGLHTFAVQYAPDARGDWCVWNRFNSDSFSRRYARLDDILRNGRRKGTFLVLYRVTRL